MKALVGILVALAVISGLAIVCPAADQPSAADVFADANLAYEAGETDKAIQLYEQLKASSGVSAALCYNLANSYARSGRTGRAVLEYERALRLAPGDGGIRATLDRLRQDKGLVPEGGASIQRAGAALGLNQWSALAAGLLTLVVAGQLALLRFPGAGKKAWPLLGTSVLLLALCVAGTTVQYRNWRQAVIVVPDAALQLSPFSGAAVTGGIEEGRLIHILKPHDGYALIRDENGRGGWLARSSFEQIPVIRKDETKEPLAK